MRRRDYEIASLAWLAGLRWNELSRMLHSHRRLYTLEQALAIGTEFYDINRQREDLVWTGKGSEWDRRHA